MFAIPEGVAKRTGKILREMKNTYKNTEIVRCNVSFHIYVYCCWAVDHVRVRPSAVNWIGDIVLRWGKCATPLAPQSAKVIRFHVFFVH